MHPASCYIDPGKSETEKSNDEEWVMSIIEMYYSSEKQYDDLIHSIGRTSIFLCLRSGSVYLPNVALCRGIKERSGFAKATQVFFRWIEPIDVDIITVLVGCHRGV